MNCVHLTVKEAVQCGNNGAKLVLQQCNLQLVVCVQTTHSTSSGYQTMRIPIYNACTKVKTLGGGMNGQSIVCETTACTW